MIRSLAYTKTGELLTNLSIQSILADQNIAWYWVDFQEATTEETSYLKDFSFHPLAIDDCLNFVQRPKLDYYNDHQFYVINTINPKNLKANEIDFFVNSQMIVTYHRATHTEIDEIWERIVTHPEFQSKGPQWIAYKLIDKVVDSFFPIAQQVEERLTILESKTGHTIRSQKLLDELFRIRRSLSYLRHVIFPMRDLIYRVVSSERLNQEVEEKRHYQDIHDHLLKLSAMIESCRDMTADIRDNYVSINSNRMNTVMMILTVITTIFMPLTFIAGIYGMNFEYMPELKWRYGYFAILGCMAMISLTMYYYFKRKGWFDE